jgi:hypothetical protein
MGIRAMTEEQVFLAALELTGPADRTAYLDKVCGGPHLHRAEVGGGGCPSRSIQEVIPEVPNWLCAIIARLQAKKPEDRFATARGRRPVAALPGGDATARACPEPLGSPTAGGGEDASLPGNHS